jgi:hypothetical protein
MIEEQNPWNYYLMFQDKFSVHINWHRQHLVENLLDLDGFISSISQNLESEKLESDNYNIPLGFFQVEQSSRIRYSYLTFLFTIFERRMRALLKILFELNPNISKSFDEYKGSFLEKTKAFLKDNLEIDITSGKMWSDINELQKIRDCIIHCGGQINESRDKIFLNHLFELKKIDLNRYNYILLTNFYCHQLGVSMKNFIEEGLEEFYRVLIELDQKKTK